MTTSLKMTRLYSCLYVDRLVLQYRTPSQHRLYSGSKEISKWCPDRILDKYSRTCFRTWDHRLQTWGRRLPTLFKVDLCQDRVLVLHNNLLWFNLPPLSLLLLNLRLFSLLYLNKFPHLHNRSNNLTLHFLLTMYRIYLISSTGYRVLVSAPHQFYLNPTCLKILLLN